jgi:adenylate cyclase
MSPKKDQEYFCDGISEEIINALAHVGSLKVIARTSAFAFKNKQVGIHEIGHKLKIRTILEGSIRKDGNRLRITAQLINVEDGFHMWSEVFDRDFKDVFAVQDEISLAIVDNLKIKLLGEEKTAIAKHATQNLEAFNLYMKGNHSWQMMTAEGFKKANEYFEHALQKDPKYALVYVGLAAVQVSSTYFGNVPPNDAFPKANTYLKKALEIDNTLAEAHCYLGVCNLDYYWNRKKAELNFTEALQLNPNSALIHIQYSLMLSSAGRHQEAISEAKRAQELDPLSSHINTYVGQTFYFDSQFDRAIEEFKSVISLNPNYYLAHSYLAGAYMGKSKPLKALEEVKKAYKLSNGVPQTVAFLAVAYYYANKKKKSEELFDSLKKRSTTEYIPATCFFMIHKVRGEEDLAFEWLERACKERDGFLFWFRVSPVESVFPSPADEAKFEALMKKYGLKK